MLLDEERLAGRGAGHRRPPLPRGVRRPELRLLLGGVHLRRRGETVLDGRNVPGCKQEFASYAHGSKGSAVISSSSHTPAHPRIYKGQKIEKIWRKPDQPDLVWKWDGPEPNPYELEWQHLLTAIRDDEPFNEVERGLKASLVTSMGRMAAHTGQVVTYDRILNSEHEFGPENDKLTLRSDPPLKPDADGKYPIPQPGILRDVEYKA